jgi:hypothetical protein
MSPDETDMKSGKRKEKRAKMCQKEEKIRKKLNVEKVKGERGGITGKRGVWGINIYILR